MRHTNAGIVAAGVAVLLLARAPAPLHAQFTRSGVVAGPAGVAVVLARASTIQPVSIAGPRASQQFRRLDATVKAKVLQAAGVESPPVSGPFVLGPNALIVPGRGWLHLTAASSLDGKVGYITMGTDAWPGEVDVYSEGNATAKMYMVHFQVRNWLSRSYSYVITNMLDGGKYTVAANPKYEAQDIVVMAALPNGTPKTAPFIMLRLATDKAASPYDVLGVEITPM